MTDLQKSFLANFNNKECVIYTDEPLMNHCAFRIGGASEVLVIPKTEAVLSEILKYADERNISLHILGNGSNVLISDDGLKGITVKLMNGLTDLLYLGDGIIVSGAGVSLTRLCNFAKEKSLTGLEFAYGIPGTVGGAVYMNAGAYNGEIKDVLFSVRSMNMKGSDITEVPASELEISYRNTPFMNNERIITSAFFKLQEGSLEEIQGRMDELMAKRKNSQPLEYPSAGSTFKRPVNGYAAALIDQSGLKGTSVGGAMVSEKHAGFVINYNNASCSDVLALMDIIKNTVFEKHGIELQPEVEILKD